MSLFKYELISGGGEGGLIIGNQIDGLIYWEFIMGEGREG